MEAVRMNKTKVLIFTDEYDDKLFTFIYNEIQGLRNFNIDVKVICERTNESRVDEFVSKIELTKNKFFLSVFLQLSKYKLFFFQTLFFRYIYARKQIIRDFNPDLIHFHFGDTCAKFYFNLRQELSIIPFFVTFHGFDASKLLADKNYVTRMQQITKNSNFNMIYVSKQLKSNIENAGIKFDKTKSYLLHYGIDLDFFSPSNRERKKSKTFIQISTFFEKKGHEHTLKAFALFKDRTNSNAKLILGGDGPLLSSIKLMVRDLGLQNEVSIIGWVSRIQAKELLQNANYFLHHSVTAECGDQEGIPNAIIEAMAMELPIISTWHSGIPELIENNVNGLLVEEKDILSYSMAMEEILEWDYLKENREKVLKNFSNHAHARRLVNIYEKSLLQ